MMKPLGYMRIHVRGHLITVHIFEHVSQVSATLSLPNSPHSGTAKISPGTTRVDGGCYAKNSVVS